MWGGWGCPPGPGSLSWLARSLVWLLRSAVRLGAGPARSLSYRVKVSGYQSGGGCPGAAASALRGLGLYGRRLPAPSLLCVCACVYGFMRGYNRRLLVVVLVVFGFMFYCLLILIFGQ